MFFKVSQKFATPMMAVCATALLAACSSNYGSSRYSSADYQYEGVYTQGAYQTQGYQAMPAQAYGYGYDMSAQYGSAGCGMPVPECGVVQPEPVITPPVVVPTTIECPAGTILNHDGQSCMENTPPPVIVHTPPVVHAPIECPPNTTLNPDGQSCMMMSDPVYTPPVVTHYPSTPYTPPVYLPPRK